MDIVVLIIILVLYLVWQALTGAASKQKPRPAPPQGERADDARPHSAAEPGSDLDEALREIREALGGRSEAPPRPQRPHQGRAPQPRTTGSHRSTDPYRARQDELRRRQRQIEAETRTFEEETRRGMDSQLERQRELTRRAEAADRRARQQDAAIPEKLTVEKDVSEAASHVPSTAIDRLYNAEAAREAIITAEVLGPPRARTGGRRRSW